MKVTREKFSHPDTAQRTDDFLLRNTPYLQKIPRSPKKYGTNSRVYKVVKVLQFKSNLNDKTHDTQQEANESACAAQRAFFF